MNIFAKRKKVVPVKPGKLTIPKSVGKMLVFIKRESRFWLKLMIMTIMIKL